MSRHFYLTYEKGNARTSVPFDSRERISRQKWSAPLGHSAEFMSRAGKKTDSRFCHDSFFDVSDLNTWVSLKKVEARLHSQRSAEEAVHRGGVPSRRRLFPKKRPFRGKVRTPGSIASAGSPSRFFFTRHKHAAKSPVSRDEIGSRRARKKTGCPPLYQKLSASVKCRSVEAAVPARYTRGQFVTRGPGKERRGKKKRTADLVAFAGPFTILQLNLPTISPPLFFGTLLKPYSGRVSNAEYAFLILKLKQRYARHSYEKN